MRAVGARYPLCRGKDDLQFGLTRHALLVIGPAAARMTGGSRTGGGSVDRLVELVAPVFGRRSDLHVGFQWPGTERRSRWDDGVFTSNKLR
jgi:hypothetical protein